MNIGELIQDIPESLATFKDMIVKYFKLYFDITDLLPAPFNTILKLFSSALIGILVFKLGKKIVEVVT